MKLKYNESLIKFLLGLFLIIFVYVAIYFFIVEPTRKKMTKANAEFVKMELGFNQALDAVNKRKLDLLKTELEELEKKEQAFVLDFNNVTDSSFRVMALVEEVLKKEFKTESGANKSIVEIPNNIDVAMVQIEVSWQGKYPELVKLVNAFETNKPIIIVDRFHLKRSDKSKGDFEINMSLTMLTHIEDRSNGDEELVVNDYLFNLET